MEFRFKLPALMALVINSIVIGFAMTGLSNFSQDSTHSGPQFYLIILGLGFFPMMITIFKSRVRIIKKK
jgi:hypothetical protein